MEEQQLAQAVKACDRKYPQVLIYISKMVDLGDMIKKAKAAQKEHAAAAQETATGPIVRQAYQRGKFKEGAANTTNTESNDTTSTAATPTPDASSSASSSSSSSSAEAVAVTPAPAPESKTPEDEDDERFVGFARIFCGTLSGDPSQQLHIFGPKYDVNNPSTRALHSSVISASSLKLYLMMGVDIQAIDKIPAGNVFAISGLSRHVLNTATISSLSAITPFRNMSYQSAPIVRVAIEPESASDLSALGKGLKLLNKADANVIITLADTGEHMIIASGELHLERCVRDLQDRFCKGVKFTVSKPIISFRETIVEQAGKVDILKEKKKKEQKKEGEKKDKANKKKKQDDEDEDDEAILAARKKKQQQQQQEQDGVDGVAASLASSDLNNDGSSSSSGTSTEPASIFASRMKVTKHMVEESTANRHITFLIQAIPLPLNLSKFLVDEKKAVPVIKHLVKTEIEAKKKAKKLQQEEKVDSVASAAAELEDANEASSVTQEEVQSFLSDLRTLLTQPIPSAISTGADSTITDGKALFTVDDADKICCFGPHSHGPNLFINRVQDLYKYTSILHALGLQQSTSNNNETTEEQTDEERISVFKSIANSITTGFQLTTATGPLCDEPMMGVAFVLEAIEVKAWDAESKGVDPSGPISSQVMTAVRSACRKAYSLRAPRLLEAMFRVDLQCHTDALGGLFAVLAKRRGKVISEEMREGTNIFNVSAYLPVAESFGFAGDMRKKTGGEASPQLIFSHWELITQDPVWTPTTEEEIEYYGTQDATPNLAKELMDAVRRRKGLAVQEKVVVHAEKQRTLKH